MLGCEGFIWDEKKSEEGWRPVSAGKERHGERETRDEMRDSVRSVTDTSGSKSIGTTTRLAESSGGGEVP